MAITNTLSLGLLKIVVNKYLKVLLTTSYKEVIVAIILVTYFIVFIDIKVFRYILQLWVVYKGFLYKVISKTKLNLITLVN